MDLILGAPRRRWARVTCDPGVRQSFRESGPVMTLGSTCGERVGSEALDMHKQPDRKGHGCSDRLRLRLAGSIHSCRSASAPRRGCSSPEGDMGQDRSSLAFDRDTLLQDIQHRGGEQAALVTKLQENHSVFHSRSKGPRAARVFRLATNQRVRGCVLLV